MTNPNHSPWSEALQQQTRQALEYPPITRDERVNFKHSSLGYAWASADDLCEGRLVLHPWQGMGLIGFVDAHALLQAGWAID